MLDLRPLRIEAWLQIGNELARHDPQAAREAYARVLALDPAHPGALQNMGTLELNSGRPAEGLAWFDRLPAHRSPTAPWLEELAARLALRGIDDSAEALFARVDPDLADRTAEECFALSKAASKAGQALQADAWEARAHLKWGREHADAGRFTDAVRSYRQAWRVCTTHVAEPLRVRLELAAALARAGRLDEARTQMQGLEPTPEDRAALPPWARDSLRALAAEGMK